MANKKIKSWLLFPLLLLMLTTCSFSSSSQVQGYVEGELIFIASPYGGELKELFVDRGDKVVTNQKLFVLDPQPQTDQLEQARENLKQAIATLTNLEKGERQTVVEAIQAQIDQAQANLALANIRLVRQQKLYEKNAVSKDEYDQALANYKVQANLVAQLEANLNEAKLGSRVDVIQAQKFSIAAAQARVEEAEWALSQKTQYAPLNGMIFDKYFHLGEYVPANQPVLSLLTPSNINIIFFVPENLLSKIKIGEKVTIRCSSCKDSYSARIYYISPEAEYTPPVIYSRDSNYKLVYRIKAKPLLSEASLFHPGQPVYVGLPNS